MKNKEYIMYQQEFGEIPDTQVDRIAYILGKRADNEKFNEMILKEAKRIKRIKTTTISFTMWKIVKPSRRPRANSRAGYIRMYVPGAKEAGDWFEEFAKENDLPYIETPCKMDMDIYEKTPSSFSMKNKVLAELGVIRPWKRTGDFDNYAKGIADCIQHGMLKDDCLVMESTQRLFYSIKPHADVTITYMNKFPEY
jgi:Holliday junction resolvase RusA-like endonuclease